MTSNCICTTFRKCLFQDDLASADWEGFKYWVNLYDWVHTAHTAQSVEHVDVFL